MHNAETSLVNFLRTGNLIFAEQLKTHKPKEIELILKSDVLTIKIHLGILKTEGIIIEIARFNTAHFSAIAIQKIAF